MKARRAPFQYCRNARVYGRKTTAMHEMSTPLPIMSPFPPLPFPPLPGRDLFFPLTFFVPNLCCTTLLFDVVGIPSAHLQAVPQADGGHLSGTRCARAAGVPGAPEAFFFLFPFVSIWWFLFFLNHPSSSTHKGFYPCTSCGHRCLPFFPWVPASASSSAELLFIPGFVFTAHRVGSFSIPTFSVSFYSRLFLHRFLS